MNKVKLNKDLLKSQKVTKQQKKEIQNLHHLLGKVFALTKKLSKSNTLSFTTGKIISDTVREIEFKLQDNWNFKRNENYHTYQNQIPECSCGEMDNKDMYGTGLAWIDINCQFHGYDTLQVFKDEVKIVDGILDFDNKGGN